LLYRQHQANAIGARGFYSKRNLKRVIEFDKTDSELAAILLQATDLETRFKEVSAVENQSLKRFLSAAEKSGFVALGSAIKEGYFKQGFFRNIYYLLMLLTGGYRKFMR